MHQILDDFSYSDNHINSDSNNFRYLLKAIFFLFAQLTMSIKITLLS